jgi:hypothetical protein
MFSATRTPTYEASAVLLVAQQEQNAGKIQPIPNYHPHRLGVSQLLLPEVASPERFLYCQDRQPNRRYEMSRYLVVVLSIVMMAATAVLTGACGTQPGGTQQVGKMQEELARGTRALLPG